MLNSWCNCYSIWKRMRSTKSEDLICQIKFLPWWQLNGCSMTSPFLSPQRVWLVRLNRNHNGQYFVNSTHLNWFYLKLEPGKSVQENYYSSSSKEMWSVWKENRLRWIKSWRKGTRVQIEKRKFIRYKKYHLFFLSVLDEVRNVVELTSIWAENERDSSWRNNMSRSYQSKCGLHLACLIPRLSGESPGARLRIWVMLKLIHVKVGWVTCETRFLVFYSSLSTRPRHVCEGLVPRLYQTLRWKWFTLGLVGWLQRFTIYGWVFRLVRLASRLILPSPSLFCQFPQRSSQWDPLADVQLRVSVNPEERELQSNSIMHKLPQRELETIKASRKPGRFLLTLS